MGRGTLSRKGIGAVPLILALVVALVGAFLLYRNRQAAPEAGKAGQGTAAGTSALRTAPPFSLKDTNGNVYSSAQLAGKPAVINFFATWCPPCRTEVPSLSQLAEDFGDYRGDFSVLMVSVADRVDEVEEFMEETLVENRFNSVLYDPSWEVTHRYGTRKLPETYLVVQGRVVERWIGAQDWNDPKIREAILEAVRGLREPEQTAALRPAAP